MAFSGTQQKCKACDKTVHFVEGISADGVSYHKNCFRCSHCNGLLAVHSLFLSAFHCFRNIHKWSMVSEMSSFVILIHCGVFRCRWATTPPAMEFYTARCILSSFWRKLAATPRRPSPVKNLFFTLLHRFFIKVFFFFANSGANHNLVSLFSISGEATKRAGICYSMKQNILSA